MQKVFPLEKQEWLIGFALLVMWALLFLPNLRTNPNWYGDESIVMEEAWTLSQGHPRYAAMRTDFLAPHPHPPLYLMILGGALKVFGNDLVVGRALQVLTGLGTAVILFWVGTRIHSKKFGFLCVAGFLCYSEVVIHFRWVRGHPMQGMWVLASVGFLIQYIQEKRLRDVVLAGLMASLAVGCHYFSYPMMIAVVVTAFIVNKRHVIPAGIASGLFLGLFLLWFLIFQDGGLQALITRLQGASQQGFRMSHSTWLDECARIYHAFVELIFVTPVYTKSGAMGVDLWLTLAFLGLAFFPFKPYRKWLIFWTLLLVFGVLKSRGSVSVFLYQAFGFIPLLALGFGGAMVQIGNFMARAFPERQALMRLLPTVAIIGIFGAFSLEGSFVHFKTKVDKYTMPSWEDAEDTMEFVNSRVKPEDLVVIPDQLFWLYKYERKAQIVQCAHYEYGISENLTQGVTKDQYWLDPSIDNAKFLVLGYRELQDGGVIGIDAVFWFPYYAGCRKIFDHVIAERWPIVYQKGEYTVLANPKLNNFPQPKPSDSTSPGQPPEQGTP